MTRTLVVDGNFYLHRISNTQPEQSRDASALFVRRFVGMVCKDALAVRAPSLLVAFDGSEVFRYSLYEGYKSGRKPSSGAYEYLPSLIEYLALCGLPCLQLAEYEADDVMASYAAQNDNVILGTRDKDCYQTLRESVTMYDSAFKVKGLPAPRTVKHTDVEGLFGLSPDKCVDYQTLVGDSVDSIPRIVSPARAKNGINRWGSIQEWANNEVAFRNVIRPRRDELKLNRKLVKLVTSIKVDIPPIVWNNDPAMTLSYINYKQWCNPKSKGLFG